MAGEREEYLSKKTGRLRKRRSDGWTKREIAIFIDHYRITGDMSASAAAAGKGVRAAGNLRAVDVTFAAQMDAAEEEYERRMEYKVALFAETGGKLPPLREDGEPAEASLENFDPHLALAWLNFRRAKKEVRGRRGGPRPRTADKEEVVQAVAKLILMVKRRTAMRGG